MKMIRKFNRPGYEPLLFGWAAGAVFSLIVQLIYNPIHLGEIGCLDFQWFYTASRFLLHGELSRAYDYPTFAASAYPVTHGICEIEHVDYPPTLFLFIGWVALFPLKVSLAIWLVTTLAACLLALYSILPRYQTILVTLTLYPVWITAALGHDGFLTAALFGGFLICLGERRTWMAGLFVGALAYKPQFGLLIPIALLAQTEWRVLISGTIATLTVAVIAGFSFGWDTWPAAVHAIIERGQFITATTENAFLTSPFGVLRNTFALPAAVAWIGQGIVSLVAARCVWVVWRNPAVGFDLKAAVLAIGSFIAAPHPFPYDLGIVVVGTVFLVRDGLVRRYPQWQRGAVISCWLATPIMPFGWWVLPAIITACFVLFFVALDRCRPAAIPHTRLGVNPGWEGAD
jgi:alpha-1,2-mannosyltransferase